MKTKYSTKGEQLSNITSILAHLPKGYHFCKNWVGHKARSFFFTTSVQTFFTSINTQQLVLQLHAEHKCLKLMPYYIYSNAR
jgi:hypothetical protein